MYAEARIGTEILSVRLDIVRIIGSNNSNISAVDHKTVPTKFLADRVLHAVGLWSAIGIMLSVCLSVCLWRCG